MKITFLGVSGGLESGKGSYNSNMLIDTDGGKTILIDAGTDLPHSLEAAGRTVDEIDAVYISHLHADHIGGLEWLGYCTYFYPSLKKIPLYTHPDHVEPLWENSLKAGMKDISDKDEMKLEDYFDIPTLKPGKVNFEFNGVQFGLMKLPHVGNTVFSYALAIQSGKKRVFITTDTSGQYDAITNLGVVSQFIMSDIIFHDCTIGYRTTVHANYDDLKAIIPSVIKRKTWLYHYSPKAEKPKYKVDGFAGFVKTGQVFEI